MPKTGVDLTAILRPDSFCAGQMDLNGYQFLDNITFLLLSYFAYVKDKSWSKSTLEEIDLVGDLVCKLPKHKVDENRKNRWGNQK